jgi:hypothetical protein
MRLLAKPFSPAQVAAILLGITLATAAAASGDSGYRIVGKWPAGGSGKWDYLIVDSPHHHLFVSRATHVQVFDLDSGKLAGDIENTPGVHGIALAQDMNRGFTSNGKADSVTVFDLQTLCDDYRDQNLGQGSRCHRLRCTEQAGVHVQWPQQ